MNRSTSQSPSLGQADPAVPGSGWVGAEPGNAARWLADLLVLTKARANVAVVATAFVGFALHADILSNWVLLVHTLAGTGLLAGGAAVANQAMEHSFDRTMTRTRNRPIAAGRFSRGAGFWLSGALAGAGCLWLGAGVNGVALLFGALAFLIYVLAYTPLKRRTPACTLVGAVPGALPLWIGWAATDAPFGLWSAVAFAVLYLWQIPHFLAIAWWRRTEYLGAGYRVLSREDRRGYTTAGQALVFAVAMVAVSLAPALMNRVTPWYWLGGVAAGVLFGVSSIRFLIRRTESAARSLFLASLYYLPAIYSLMLLFRKS
jgi:protoheme IX farnesyltransferase